MSRRRPSPTTVAPAKAKGYTPLHVLLAVDLAPAPMFGWGLRPGAARDAFGRIAVLSSEPLSLGARLDCDVVDYVTALHALTLDLVDLTGAKTTGRRHPAHAALAERLQDIEWLATTGGVR